MTVPNPFDPDLQVPADPADRDPLCMDRRAFLARLAGISAALAVMPVAALSAGESQAWRDEPPWTTFAAVQDQLFPTGPDSPGAREINATGYLRNMIDQPVIDQDDRTFLRKGVGWLEDLSRDKQGVTFVELTPDQREQMLRLIASSRAGENWLSLLLLFVFEALLSDPVYGGNPDGIGWKWLEHQPGFPTPPPEKRYFKL